MSTAGGAHGGRGSERGSLAARGPYDLKDAQWSGLGGGGDVGVVGVMVNL